MAFTRTWDTAYEATPANTDDISNDAERLRDTKVDVRERMEQDHSWAGDSDDGFHKFATMMKRSSDPAAAADKLILYTKTNSDKLYGREPSGEILQITPPVGSGFVTFLSTQPNGYIFADGRTIGNSTSGADHQGERFRELFNAIKSEGYGNAGTEDFDSSDTVTLPDLRDRVPVGERAMGSTDAGRIDNAATTLSDTGGEDQHTLTNAEMPSHNHSGTTDNSTVNLRDSGDAGTGNGVPIDTTSGGTTRTMADSSHNHSFSTSTAGSDNAHNNLQPFLVVNWIIKY